MRVKLFRDKYYAVWSEHGETKRLSLRTDSVELAKQRLADLQRQPVGETAAEIFVAYADDRRDRTTHARMLDAWKRLEEHFGYLRPDQITRMTCRSYTAARRRDDVSDGTIIKELATLRAALRWHDAGTPAQFEMPSAPAPRDRFLTKGEFVKLRDACGGPHVRLFVILALSTAGRQSAILELTWDRVDFERGLIALALPDSHGRKKGRATVPMTDMARQALEEAKRGALTDHVIEYAEKPVRSIKKGFSNACRRAGLGNVTPHTLRHTAAVWMAEAGRPMTEIASYLGHSDSHITERVYAKYSPDYLRNAAAALDIETACA